MPTEVAHYDSSSDAALLECTVAGDRTAFERLVFRHQAAVLRFVRFLGANESDADDVLQETFLAVYRSAASYRGDSSVRTWILVIARNKTFRMVHPAEDTTEFDEATVWELGRRAGWGQASPEVLAIQSERKQQLQNALESLDAIARQVLVLRDLEGLSGDETARILRLTLKAMKSRLHRARLKLSAALRQGGGSIGQR